MKLRRAEEELEGFVAFQRKLLGHEKRHGGLSPGATDSATGEKLTTEDFIERYSIALWVLIELEAKFAVS